MWAPIALRTKLFAPPSQPSTKRACTLCCSPLSRSCTVTRARSVLIWTASTTSRCRTTRLPDTSSGCSATAARAPVGRTCWPAGSRWRSHHPRGGIRRAPACSDRGAAARGPAGRSRELLGDTQPPRQKSEHLVVEVHGARLRIDIDPAVEQQALNAVLRQLCCRRDACRSRADDYHRHEAGQSAHANLIRLRWVPSAILPSSVPTVASTTSPSRR